MEFGDLDKEFFPIGQQLGNPLLLLEQYSDDELDEDSGEEDNHALSEDQSAAFDGQTKTAGKETGDIGNIDESEPSDEQLEPLVIDRDSISQDPLQNLGKNDRPANDSDDLDRVTNPAEEVIYPAVSDVLVGGDVSSGWKAVIHEESNQYYYWNITTGETSWEVPADLAQATDTNCLEKNSADTEEKQNAVVDTTKSSVPLDTVHGDSTIEQLNTGFEGNCKTNDGSGQGTKMDGYNGGYKGNSADDLTEKRDFDKNYVTSLLADTLLGNAIASSAKICYSRHSEERESGTDVCLQLLKHCESLLDRLHTLKGLSCHLQGHDLISKYTLEVEIRLADIKALSCHGLSLSPFWLHSKCQLKQLETAIDDVIPQYNSDPMNEVVATKKLLEGIGNEVDSGEKKPLFPAGVSHASEYVVQEGAINAGHVSPIGHSAAHSGDSVRGKSEVSGLAIHSELTPKTVLHSGEDVDMDVDMEVEDSVAIVHSPIRDASGAQYHVLSEQSNMHNLHSDRVSSVPVQIFSVPPLPDDEWIPPPPPDDEPFPPPPPDDEPFPPPPSDIDPPPLPPETSIPPPSHSESIQPFSYTEQYNLSHPGCSLEFYGQTNTGVSGATVYAHPEGGQVAVSHLPQYYDGVTNLYGAAPLVVNHVEPGAYFGLQNGTVNPVSLVSGAAMESSQIHSESIPESLGSDTAGSFDAHAESWSSLLPMTKVNVLEAGLGAVKANSGVPDFEAPAASADIKSVSVSSTSSAKNTVASKATASKVQSKVSRNKKRSAAVVSTLRSSKKVSSLVDKWKAAKEELHEEEEEPENAYDMLEKKRQREVEEWRAQQIATGEAKENANFQPLGGDWRERVKRRRAQKMNETEQSESDVTEENQQPDLVALARGLPSGWQVYWDDTSKQIYYGNVITSETTWTRPTD